MRVAKNVIRLGMVTALLSLCLPTVPVFAKAAGCYETTESDYKSVACSDAVKNDARTKCFVRSSPTTSFENIDCVALDSSSSSGPSSSGGVSTSGRSLTGDLSGSEGKIEAYLQDAVNLLTAVAGLAIAASVIFAGIKYSSSGGDPKATAEAKERIRNAVIATVALALLFTFLQWIIPGGAFN